MEAIRWNLAATLLIATAALGVGCIIEPERDEGERCACSKQCAEGLYCTDHEQPSEVDGSCGEGAGECRAFRHEGEACNEDASNLLRCAGALICRPLEHVCGTRLAAGESCEGKTTSECAKGLTCDLALDPPQCTAPRTQGELCGTSNDCASPLVCNSGFDPGRCMPAGASGSGEPCGQDADCTAGLVCNSASEQCAAPFSSPAGAPCNQDVHCGSHHCITWSDGNQGIWIGKCS